MVLLSWDIASTTGHDCLGTLPTRRIEHALDARKILEFVSLDKTRWIFNFRGGVCVRRCRFRCLPSTEVEADADLAEWQELPNVIEDPRRTVYSIAKKPRLELVAEHEKCHVVDYRPSKKIFILLACLLIITLFVGVTKTLTSFFFVEI